MKKTLNESAQYMTRYGSEIIPGNVYTLNKLGVDRTRCILKIEDYTIPCMPFHLGFKHSVLLVSLSKQELIFFQRYVNNAAVFSIALNPDHKPEPINFYLRCSVNAIGQMKGRENVGLFVVDYKVSPDEMVSMLGKFLESQERIKAQYNDYGKTVIKMTPEIARIMGFNFYATMTEASAEPKRIQLMGISSKSLEYMEAEKSSILRPGSNVSFQLFFKKFRVDVPGIVNESFTLPQGIIRTLASLSFSAELVEIIDDYWYNSRTNPSLKAQAE